MTVAAIVPAAGRGERLGAARPKALVEVGGRTLLEHSVAAVRAGGGEFVVVAAPLEALAEVALLLPDVVVVAGGDTRQQSVRNALQVIPQTCDVVLVHDAARAFVPADVVRRVVAAVRAGADAVIPVVGLADTVKQVADDGSVLRTVDRATLRAVQTPQGFRRDVLVRAHESDHAATDDAALAEAVGVVVQTVEGSPYAFKVTTAFDLAVAAAVVAGRGVDVGA
jgi:2-C-methyl-D-erythritol 4-phosphate cytidylyltransferase